MSKVLLVSSTKGVGKYKNLNHEELIAAIARHGVIKEDNGKLVKYLMDSSHWSPLDMINFTFEIETSRDIGRQILRHQSIKFQEHSTRYSSRVQFEPIELRKEHPTNRQSSTEVIGIVEIDKDGWEYVGDHSAQSHEYIAKAAHALVLLEEAYKGMIFTGVAKETARHFLPGALTTTMSANGTLRSWLAFLNVRLDHHAEKEIQIIAGLIGEALEKELPNVFSNIDWKQGMFL